VGSTVAEAPQSAEVDTNLTEEEGRRSVA
jgi:hypothetical protein